MLFRSIDKTNDLSMTTLRKNEKFNTTLGLILNTLLLDASEAESQVNEDVDGAV